MEYLKWELAGELKAYNRLREEVREMTEERDRAARALGLAEARADGGAREIISRAAGAKTTSAGHEEWTMRRIDDAPNRRSWCHAPGVDEVGYF